METVTKTESPEGPPAPHETGIMFALWSGDKLAPSILRYYAALCRGHGCPEDYSDQIEDAAGEFDRWQAANPAATKLPG